tara:strand:+ start:611 stop:859 length:249 start_codon:yes stop_codon:yes gene_type:complete
VIVPGHYTSLTSSPPTPPPADTAALAQNVLHLALTRLSARLLARDQWLAALLSACRPSDLIDFNCFYIENKQDMARCVFGLI